MVGVVKPSGEVSRRQPSAPADLKPLVQVKLVNRERDVESGQNGKEADLGHECVPVLLLQRVVETVIPLVQEHVYQNQRQFDRNDGRKQQTTGQFVFRTEVASSNPPHGGERRADVGHRLQSSRKRPQWPEKM